MLMNPLAGDDFKVLIRKQSSGLTFADKDGEYNLNEIELEQEHYTKIFHIPNIRKFVCEMQPCSKSLFLWLQYEADNGKDYLWINKVRYMSECQVKSINTFKAAVKELMDKLIICPSSIKGVYWINPAVFFNGSRINKYKSKLKEI